MVSRCAEKELARERIEREGSAVCSERKYADYSDTGGATEAASAHSPPQPVLQQSATTLAHVGSEAAAAVLHCRGRGSAADHQRKRRTKKEAQEDLVVAELSPAMKHSGRGRHVGQVRARLQPAELAISMAGNVATSSTYAGGTQQHKKEKGREAAAIGIGMACLGPGCSKRHQLLGALNMEESREGGKEERGRRLLGCCCWLPTIGDRSREERGDSSSSSSSPSRKCW